MFFGLGLGLGLLYWIIIPGIGLYNIGLSADSTDGAQHDLPFCKFHNLSYSWN